MTRLEFHTSDAYRKLTASVAENLTSTAYNFMPSAIG